MPAQKWLHSPPETGASIINARPPVSSLIRVATATAAVGSRVVPSIRMVCGLVDVLDSEEGDEWALGGEETASDDVSVDRGSGRVGVLSGREMRPVSRPVEGSR